MPFQHEKSLTRKIMAKLALNLAQFKSAGVYIQEIDNTTEITVESNSLRLLVGFNPKGPFNRPVFLSNENDRVKIFGDIDQKLEAKGNYFNRMAQTLVSAGPLFALNLLKVDDAYDGEDQVNYAAFSLNAGYPNPELISTNGTIYGEVDKNPVDDTVYYNRANNIIPYVGNAPYSAFYDRSRFWIPSEENLTAVAARGVGDGTETTVFNSSNFFNLANVGTEEISVLVFKPEALKGYDITCAEWYDGEENIPYGFIRPNDYIADYFIQVVVVKGNWGDFKKLATDTLWGDFFDANGIKKNKINQFLSTAGVSTLGSWIGSIIPDFEDKLGNPQNIVDKINNSTTVTGLLAAFNRDAALTLNYDYDFEDTDDEDNKGGWFQDIDGDGNFDRGQESIDSREGTPYDDGKPKNDLFLIDMVGHEFTKGYPTDKYNTETQKYERRYGINFLSYNYDSDTPDDLLTPMNFASYFHETGAVPPEIQNMFIIANEHAAAKLGLGDYVKNFPGEGEEYGHLLIPGITRIIKKVALTLTISESDAQKLYGNRDQTVEVTDAKFIYKGKEYLYSGYAIQNYRLKRFYVWLYTAVEPVEIISAEEAMISVDNDTEMDVQITDLTQDSIIDFQYEDYAFRLFINSDEDTEGDKALAGDLNTNEGFTDEISVNAAFGMYVDGEFYTQAEENGWKVRAYTKRYDENGNVVLDGEGHIVKDWVDYDLSEDRFNTIVLNEIYIDGTGIYKDDGTPVNAADLPAGYKIGMTLNHVKADIYVGGQVTKQAAITDPIVSANLKFIPMKGLAISKRHMPGYDEQGNLDVEAGVNKIYSLLMEDEGVLRGLCNPQMIDFRYIIDSMGYGLDSMMGGKVYLSQLAQKRQSCTAILNAPSKRHFSISTNPYFCDSFTEGVEIRPAFDTSYIASGGNTELYHSKIFSLPDLDNGASFTGVFWPWLQYTVNRKKIMVPPAADVANVFIRKFTGGDPYAIAANRNGVLSNRYLTGLEYQADQQDRDYLEPMGINTIIADGQDIMIYGNQTAYQRVDSDLNKLHVRENLNTIELRCKAVLKNYVFVYNTPVTRGEIVKRLDPILSAMKTSGAISWYNIQCDDKNNTDEIIEQDFGIVDISVIFGHGMEKILTRITLERKSIMVRSGY